MKLKLTRERQDMLSAELANCHEELLSCPSPVTASPPPSPSTASPSKVHGGLDWRPHLILLRHVREEPEQLLLVGGLAHLTAGQAHGRALLSMLLLEQREANTLVVSPLDARVDEARGAVDESLPHRELLGRCEA